jgi:hypothetical protein
LSEDIVVDGEAFEVGELVPVQHQGTGITVAPEVTAQDLVRRLDVIRAAASEAMEKDVDYGVIQGTGSKPTLLKPGAEKLAVLFQLDIQIDNEKLWDGNHLTVMSKAIVYHAPTGTRLGMGEGMCSTKESKYAYRNQNRKCPDCGAEAIIKGKEEYGGGWVCFKKRGGCGQKFRDESPEITSQEAGKVDNPDLPDSWNVAVKMSEKRARIDAVLAVTGASALFTQDLDTDDGSQARTGASTVSQEVRSDGKQQQSGARSWTEWESLMVSLEVPQPKVWLQSAAEAANIVGNKAWGGELSQRANRVLLHFADNPPDGTLGFLSVPEIQKGYAVGFDGVVVDNSQPQVETTDEQHPLLATPKPKENP